jgi:hypothetical protein
VRLQLLLLVLLHTCWGLRAASHKAVCAVAAAAGAAAAAAPHAPRLPPPLLRPRRLLDTCFQLCCVFAAAGWRLTPCCITTTLTTSLLVHATRSCAPARSPAMGSSALL